MSQPISAHLPHVTSHAEAIGSVVFLAVLAVVTIAAIIAGRRRGGRRRR
jgi:hypothetical protein